MFYTEFMIGAYIGVLVVTCLLLLTTAFSAGKREKTEERRKGEPEGETPLLLPAPKGETVTFVITRREIAEDTRGSGDPDITVAEYPCQPQLPTTLKYKNMTYAMLYATDRGVLIVARLTDAYADELICKYPGIRRASFPRGANWYCVPVEGAFTDKEEVYRILLEARSFLILTGGRGKQV